MEQNFDLSAFKIVVHHKKLSAVQFKAIKRCQLE